MDFEYAGWTDRAFELGDLVEHPQSRATPDAAWERFIDGFDLCDHERARYVAARRLLCFFWLARWWPVADQPSTTDRFTAQVDRAEQLLTPCACGRGWARKAHETLSRASEGKLHLTGLHPAGD